MTISTLLRLIRGIRLKTFEKGEVLIEKESKEGDIFFIRKGLVRAYFYNEKGDEITFQIFAEKIFFWKCSCHDAPSTVEVYL
jgi:CRP-like cAMP-binding protein